MLVRLWAWSRDQVIPILGHTSGNTAITLFESLWERSSMERRVEFEGGSNSGIRSDLQRAVRNEVC